MPGAYSKPCEISKMMRLIENAGIMRTVHSDMFRYIQGHSAIFSHVQVNIKTCLGIPRDSKGY